MTLSVSAASLDDKVIYMENVKELITLTGNMRDDTHVYSRGGYVSFSDIEEDRQRVATSLRDLHHKFQTVDIKIDDDFAELNLYMQHLNEVTSELDPMTTFRAYTLLTQEMIRLGQQVQEKFFINSGERHQRVSSVMMKNILTVMENLAVLRGLGSGAAACGECDDEEQLELKAYVADVIDHVDALSLEMQALKWSYPKSYPAKLDAHLNEYQKRVEKYILLVETKLIDVERVDLDQYDFYSNGTSLIDQTLKYYSMNEMILKN